MGLECTPQAHKHGHRSVVERLNICRVQVWFFTSYNTLIYFDAIRMKFEQKSGEQQTRRAFDIFEHDKKDIQNDKERHKYPKSDAWDFRSVSMQAIKFNQFLSFPQTKILQPAENGKAHQTVVLISRMLMH